MYILSMSYKLKQNDKRRDNSEWWKKKNNEKENAQYVKGRTLNSDLCQTSSSHNNANKTLGYISW